jgi:hypothetical protein
VWETNPDAIDWCSYGNRQGLTDIAILDESEETLLEWTDPAESVRLAASELLEAVSAGRGGAQYRAALPPVPGLDTDSYEIAAICDRAIAKAKPPQP